ncbi:hypothetical protein B0F90DRAFT_1820683 [Multifurca ochricompacta]|uniref:Uncharacterized protein n=1 Tax=Multifurca ochricompacta TaxID=376703 RepID=A0AAD4LZ59_9AGAM|nr:hypothetical protein B0F90DRAFT_1820683 [Multifurca ochricompacta]
MFSRTNLILILFLSLGLSSSAVGAIPNLPLRGRDSSSCPVVQTVTVTVTGGLPAPTQVSSQLTSTPARPSSTPKDSNNSVSDPPPCSSKATGIGSPKTGSTRNGQGNNNKGKGNNNNNNNNGGVSDTGTGKGGSATITQGTSLTTTTSSVVSTTSTGTGGNNVGSGGTSGNGNEGDPQSSLTLDPRVIATGFENNGQDTPTPGQVASLTSSNNFINFCLTVPNKPITNGLQIKAGSCNPATIGVIAATTNMPSSKFVSPQNFGTVKANTAFTIVMAINNLEAGKFVNAAQNYYAAPQQVNTQGNIIGHTHFVIQAVDSYTSTLPLDPNAFAFFKGVNTPAASDGTVSVTVDAGLPAGVYRLASINTAANHQPVLVAVAQHGSLDDQIYFTVTGDGNPVPPPESSNNASGNTNSTTPSSAATTETAPANSNDSKGVNLGEGSGAASSTLAPLPPSSPPCGTMTSAGRTSQSLTSAPASSSSSSSLPSLPTLTRRTIGVRKDRN